MVWGSNWGSKKHQGQLSHQLAEKRGSFMNILLIGGGGREHALAWKLAKSPMLTTLFIAPGNDGMAKLGQLTRLDVTNHQNVIEFCRKNTIELVIVGPEAPLVAGLVDDLERAQIPAFGPSRAAAALEGSKGFTKDICRDYNIPTASYARFDNELQALDYVRRNGAPIVIKADGLAAGKGVIMAQTLDEAEAAIKDCFDGQFGDAGAEVVIEETLYGEEASFFVLSDGEHTLPLVTAQDHKRAFDGDKGPNTGGMGAYSPAPVMTKALIDETMTSIIEPTVKALKDKGTPYKGVLYAGLMITKDGPKLIEYNARFGDPECQVLMMRLKSDILPALLAVSNGSLHKITLEWHEWPALTIVMAAKGYPGTYQKGTEIKNLRVAAEPDNIEIFHAGTTYDEGQWRANGGRVLNLTAIGPTIKAALENAYNAIGKIDWPEGFYRKDIAWRAVEREERNNGTK